MGAGQGHEREAANALLGALTPRPIFSEKIFRQGGLLLLQASNGCPLDISFASTLFYEGTVCERRRRVSVTKGLEVWTLSPEDLIIYKCIAGRPRDKQDVEGVIIRQGEKLDVAYCRQVLTQFEECVPSHSVSGVFEDALRAAGKGGAVKKRRAGKKPRK